MLWRSLLRFGFGHEARLQIGDFPSARLIAVGTIPPVPTVLAELRGTARDGSTAYTRHRFLRPDA